MLMLIRKASKKRDTDVKVIPKQKLVLDYNSHVRELNKYDAIVMHIKIKWTTNLHFIEYLIFNAIFNTFILFNKCFADPLISN